MQGLPRLATQLRDFVLRRPLPSNGPFRLWVDITSRCNLKCKACPQRMLPDTQRRDMPDELLNSLVEQVASGAAREVNLFHRGEPLLHPRIGDWARRFREAGALVRLHSNATLLDQAKVEALLEAAPQFFTCSIDSLDSEAYAAARPGADLERTLNGLEMLLAERGRRGLAQPRATLLLMGSQTRSPQAGARLKRLKNLGLDRVVWRAPHNWGGALGVSCPWQAARLHLSLVWPGRAVRWRGDALPPGFFRANRTGQCRGAAAYGNMAGPGIAEPAPGSRGIGAGRLSGVPGLRPGAAAFCPGAAHGTFA
jgi:hypothetical protein